MEDNNRKNLVRDIAHEYVNKYTCAIMSDTPGVYQAEAAEANDWLFMKINEHHITKDELKEAIEICEEEAADLGTACVYDGQLFSTKFFRG